MKKIIFLAFTAICILLSGCETNETNETNEPQDVYILNDSIYIKNMDLETKVTFYAIDSVTPWINDMGFWVSKWNKEYEYYERSAEFTFYNDKERTFTCYLPRNNKYELLACTGSQTFHFETEGQAQTYRIEFYNDKEYYVSNLFIKSFELESIDY